MTYARLIVVFLLAATFGCAGARSRISFDEARVPISMSGVVLDGNGDYLSSEHYVKLDRLDAQKRAWGTLFGFLPLGSLDFSDEVNEVVGATNGTAVVNMVVEELPNSCQWINVFLGLGQVLPGCVEVRIRGDIIREAGAQGG